MFISEPGRVYRWSFIFGDEFLERKYEFIHVFPSTDIPYPDSPIKLVPLSEPWSWESLLEQETDDKQETRRQVTRKIFFCYPCCFSYKSFKNFTKHLSGCKSCSGTSHVQRNNMEEKHEEI